MIGQRKARRVKTVLGWIINTRAFMVLLPEDKYIAYSNQRKEILKAGKVGNKNLQNIIGWLQRASYVALHSKYFLNRIQYLQQVTEKQGWANLPNLVKEDLGLWLLFLRYTRSGASINHLVFRKPLHFFWVDSCPFGLGGYSASDRAWRFYIPPRLRSEHINNVLKFMATIVIIWIEVLENKIPPLACRLVCSDSSSTVEWLHKNNFNPEEKDVHDECIRHIARIIMLGNCMLYSQHQTGKHKTITNISSRYHFLTDSQILALIKHLFST